MTLGDDVPLGVARDYLRQRVDHGAKCPLCTQFAKVYRRKVNSGQAQSLIKWWRATGQEWTHVPTVVGRRSAEEGKLVHWGLVEEADTRNGYWRITDAGRNFVLGHSLIPKYAVLYDGRCLGHEGDAVSIRDALGSHFDFAELMTS